MPCAHPVSSGARSTQPGTTVPRCPVSPQLRINRNPNSIPVGGETPGCSYTEFTELTITFPLGHSRSPVAREPRGTWAPNARALERSRARAAALGFRGPIWVADQGGWSGSRAAEPPPGLAARRWSPSPGRSCRVEFLSSTLPGSSSRTTRLVLLQAIN